LAKKQRKKSEGAKIAIKKSEGGCYAERRFFLGPKLADVKTGITFQFRTKKHKEFQDFHKCPV